MLQRQALAYIFFFKIGYIFKGRNLIRVLKNILDALKFVRKSHLGLCYVATPVLSQTYKRTSDGSENVSKNPNPTPTWQPLPVIRGEHICEHALVNLLFLRDQCGPDRVLRAQSL